MRAAMKPKGTAELIALLRKRHERFLIAVDDDGRFHIRKTLCVTHDDINGEARYDAKPLASGDTLLAALRAAARRRSSSVRP